MLKLGTCVKRSLRFRMKIVKIVIIIKSYVLLDNCGQTVYWVSCLRNLAPFWKHLLEKNLKVIDINNMNELHYQR